MKNQFVKKNMHVLLWFTLFLALYFIFSSSEPKENNTKHRQFNGAVQNKDKGDCSPENIKRRLPYFYKYSDAGYSHLAADLMKDCNFVDIDAEIKKEIGEAIAKS